ncbi:hypothetical protein B296_00010553 [Ensete ventricosum]|uniref:Uncharacterized protein n=1 Tax=Ensete ventricosum TaxID=4639 RepID=A0A426YET3_ENSVE|nr:hypothetical protein B296_00010553 [Ensete ventricosum]
MGRLAPTHKGGACGPSGRVRTVVIVCGQRCLPVVCSIAACAEAVAMVTRTKAVRLLPDLFSHFIKNFNMSKFTVTLPKLLNMLREAKSAIKKEKSVLYISETKKEGK